MDDPFVNCCIEVLKTEQNSTEEVGHLAQLLPCARTRAQQRSTDLQHLCCKALINKLISIWFHVGYFEIISHSLVFLGYIYMKLTRRKHPDRLADPCKHSSVNWMATGSRLPRSGHEFFSFLHLFKHTFCTNFK